MEELEKEVITATVDLTIDDLIREDRVTDDFYIVKDEYDFALFQDYSDAKIYAERRARTCYVTCKIYETTCLLTVSADDIEEMD